jgi:hypothetical protein
VDEGAGYATHIKERNRWGQQLREYEKIGGLCQARLRMLSATSVLWLIRCLLQVKHPQGTQRPGLARLMLLMFVLATCCFAIPLALELV